MDCFYFALCNAAKAAPDDAGLLRCRGAFAVGRLVLVVTVIAAVFGLIDSAAQRPGSAPAVAFLQDHEHGAR